MITLKDTIKRCQIIAENNDAMAEDYAENNTSGLFTNQITYHRKCAEEYRQIAEWLKELQAYRKERA